MQEVDNFIGQQVLLLPLCEINLSQMSHLLVQLGPSQPRLVSQSHSSLEPMLDQLGPLECHIDSGKLYGQACPMGQVNKIFFAVDFIFSGGISSSSSTSNFLNNFIVKSIVLKGGVLEVGLLF